MEKNIKIGIGLFICSLVIMIIGLILIGITEEGFFTLKLFGVSGLFQMPDIDKEFITNLGTIQTGVILATIITPILFGLSILTFGYDYISKQKKTPNISN